MKQRSTAIETALRQQRQKKRRMEVMAFACCKGVEAEKAEATSSCFILM